MKNSKVIESLRLMDLGRPLSPKIIAQLSSLQELDLSHTKIAVLPKSIGQLSSLQTLDLRYTKIVTLPESIGQLSNLRKLALYDAPIKKLPNSIGQLLNLQSLSLSGTQITALSESIGQLSRLQALYLRDTQITVLPESIGQLSSLKTLWLQNCHLKSIPYSLVQLGLPFVIDEFFTENCINLTGVMLDDGYLSLFAQPREVIEAYYRGKKQAVNECKVIFLGDGGAGKSSLIERIIHPEKESIPDFLPTDGIKMTKWETALGDKPLTIRFLDFGGQEIMHSMHRCFLTKNTVYVVVCESRDDAEIDSVAARWMETVKSFAPECPVLLALNKSDLNPNAKVNERDLKRINPQYRHTLHMSAKTGEGVQQLVNSVLREVPDCLKQVYGNAGFLGLKQDLENMKEDYLLPEQFRKKCDNFEIEENLRRDVINWFQELGVAYVYSMTFRDIYVLNPAWLTNGIYRLILRTPNSGFLRHSTIRETLQTPNPSDMNPDKTYSGQEMEFILYIMRKFEISLELPNGQDNVEMIPMKMDKTPPPRYDDFSKADALHLRWEAEYLPNNLIHRLMIRKHAELKLDDEEQKCVWRTGGWFHNTTNDCEALAEITNKDRALDVYVRGRHDARVYMESFCTEILRILQDLGITATEYVYYTLAGKSGKVPYPYETIVYIYRENQKSHQNHKIFITELKAFVSPAEILRENYMRWETESMRDKLTGGITNNFYEKVENVQTTEGKGNISQINKSQ